MSGLWAQSVGSWLEHPFYVHHNNSNVIISRRASVLGTERCYGQWQTSIAGRQGLEPAPPKRGRCVWLLGWWWCVGTLVSSCQESEGGGGLPSLQHLPVLLARGQGRNRNTSSEPRIARPLRLNINFTSHFLNGCPTQDGQSEGLRSITKVAFADPAPPPIHQPPTLHHPPQPSNPGVAPAPTFSKRWGEIGGSSALEPLPEPRGACTCKCTAQAQPGSQNAPRPTSHAACHPSVSLQQTSDVLYTCVRELPVLYMVVTGLEMTQSVVQATGGL